MWGSACECVSQCVTAQSCDKGHHALLKSPSNVRLHALRVRLGVSRRLVQLLDPSARNVERLAQFGRSGARVSV
jgi:hypothetical protein